MIKIILSSYITTPYVIPIDKCERYEIPLPIQKGQNRISIFVYYDYMAGLF